MRCAVLMPFMFNGKEQKAGTEVDLPEGLARDLINRQRARLLTKQAPPAGPISTKSAAALVKGASAKGETDAV